MLLEDTWGKGHQSRAVTDEDRLVMYITLVDDLPAGSFEITDYTTGGTTTEQPVINFAVIKGVAA